MVEYYGAFQTEDHIYIVMEYCGGGDLLEKLLRDKKAMHEKRVAIDVALPCLSILRTLHEMRIIHRWVLAVGQPDGQALKPESCLPAIRSVHPKGPRLQ